MPNGIISPAGKLKTPETDLYVHFPPNFESEKDLTDQIVFSDPQRWCCQVERHSQNRA